MSLLDGGELGALVRAHDWASTPLGRSRAGRRACRTAVGLILLSPVPIVMLWGEDGIMIYNDAYSVFAGGRHPRLLGSKVREGWPEVAAFNDHVMKVGLAGGTLAYRDQELTLYRNGEPEQVWMNLDYSPVLDESGRPGGVIAIVVETTARVLAEQQQAFLAGLGDALRDIADPHVVMATAAELLGGIWAPVASATARSRATATRPTWSSSATGTSTMSRRSPAAITFAATPTPSRPISRRAFRT